MAEMKTAAYVCSGCGLGDKLDIAQLSKIAQKDGKMALVREHDFLCNNEGVQMIRDDIEKEAVTHICIAACSRRSKTEAFNSPTVVMTGANLREGVVWVVAEGSEHDEVRQEMADDYVRMGCAELKKVKQPEGKADTTHLKNILVVGGGMSGLNAAYEAAETGYEVILVEKQAALGGWANKMWKRVPFKTPFAEPQDTGVAELAAKVSAHPFIKVHLNSTVAETAGAPGRFAVKLAQESGAVSEVKVGSIVQATGFTTYDIDKLPELGGGQANVVDQAGLEAMAQAANGGVLKRADGKEIKSVVFLQCAGQRDDSGKHLAYCSGHCCATSIKQAMYFKDANPDVNAVVVYDDLRIPGMGEDFYRSAQHKGVIFAKGKASGVAAAGSGCKVNYRDLSSMPMPRLEADLVVLATGQVPTSGVDVVTWDKLSKDADNGSEEAKQQKSELKNISILNLTYRQGPDVPKLKYGFADSHFICFPYETQRTGIYTAGPVRRPMDMLQATEDATGAALKAIQAVENASPPGKLPGYSGTAWSRPGGSTNSSSRWRYISRTVSCRASRTR
jgi:quinone-modifying oxidoreductase subunit QmoB